jgi:hypothetical protein
MTIILNISILVFRLSARCLDTFFFSLLYAPYPSNALIHGPQREAFEAFMPRKALFLIRSINDMLCEHWRLNRNLLFTVRTDWKILVYLLK